MPGRTALEQLVATMTIAELAQRSGHSVEDIVGWAMAGNKPRRSAATNGTSAPSKSRATGTTVNTRTAESRAVYDDGVLTAVRDSPAPIGAAKIRDAVGGTPLQVRAALNRLIESGAVTYQGRARATRYQTS